MILGGPSGGRLAAIAARTVGRRVMLADGESVGTVTRVNASGMVVVLDRAAHLPDAEPSRVRRGVCADQIGAWLT